MKVLEVSRRANYYSPRNRANFSVLYIDGIASLQLSRIRIFFSFGFVIGCATGGKQICLLCIHKLLKGFGLISSFVCYNQQFQTFHQLGSNPVEPKFRELSENVIPTVLDRKIARKTA